MLAKWFHDEIEACRPGSRDVDDPQMSQLADALIHDPAVRQRYEAAQRLDGRLGEAFRAVPVPAGLADRLLARLEQLPATTETSTAETSTAGAVPAVRHRRFTSRRLTSRRFAARRLVVALAAALLLAVGIWALRSPSAPRGAK